MPDRHFDHQIIGHVFGRFDGDYALIYYTTVQIKLIFASKLNLQTSLP